MSDAMTDIARDKKLANKVKQIRNLQGNFDDAPSVSLAENIIDGLLELRNMKRGYWESVNYKEIDKDLNKYGDYLTKSL